VWLRVGDDFVEVCGGREGDDYEARLEVGHPLTEQVRGVFGDLLDVLRFSRETAFEMVTQPEERERCSDVAWERARVLARWLFGPSATVSHRHVVQRLEGELKEAWFAGRLHAKVRCPPEVDGPRQVALFRLRRLEAEAMAASESAVADELAAILEREVARDEPREA
jgi:hypothetical protein